MVPASTSSLSSPRPKRMQSSQSLAEDQDHNTIPDPRIRVEPPTNGDGTATPSHHPDLDQEVAALSTKLINAINHQTTLDDTLSETRQELESSRERVKELEGLVARQQETLSGDVWVKRKGVEEEKRQFLARISEEKRQRMAVEKDKKKIEQELETLTVSLFEEANRMVITAKENAKSDQEALHRKNDQLRAQLADTEGLLRFQQDQLTELKLVMEQMTADQDENSGTAPSSPGFSKFDTRDDDTQISEGASQSGVVESFSPTYPTNLPHLLHPVLRTDLSSYDDFVSLVKTSKKAAPSRASSGSYSGLNPILGLASGVSAPSNASTTSLSTVGTPSSSNFSPQTPNTPASVVSASSATSSAPLPPLKETKFYKRILAEDIEPTLRLDIARGLSWLARRSVISAMTEGNLVVEPIPVNSPFASVSKPQHYPCSLCGEARKEEKHLRNHRFRTSESDSAQRYPLCDYCLNRVRSTCDFLGFLRMVKDGHWRANDIDAERAAWEESVRLRDQMFWSRIGGGVVPAHSPVQAGSVGERSARPSQEAGQRSVDGNKAGVQTEDHGSVDSIIPSTQDDLPSDNARLNEAADTASQDLSPTPADRSNITPRPRDSTLSTDPLTGDQGKQRLSITIPGAFDDTFTV